jgi:hypothetical protein
MNCPSCEIEMEQVDTTYSNVTTSKGQHTGDVYFCECCESHYLDNFLSGQLETFSY